MTKTAFFGTPEAAVPILEGLAARTDVAAVVTRADARRGRGRKPQAPPVKTAAERLGLPVVQPAGLHEVVGMLSEVDVGVLAAFGRLIPEVLLDAPGHGVLNVHFSVLPRWRGAAPVARSILAGDQESGVTIIRMDEGLDTGPILATTRTLIAADESAGALTKRLALMGGDLLGAVLVDYLGGRAALVEQRSADATEAPKLLPEEGRIDPSATAGEIMLQVRAFSPRPGAWGMVDGDRLRLLEVRVSPDDLPIGRLVLSEGRLLLGTGQDSLEVTLLQPAGASAMSGVDWMNGRRGRPAVLS